VPPGNKLEALESIGRGSIRSGSRTNGESAFVFERWTNSHRSRNSSTIIEHPATTLIPADPDGRFLNDGLSQTGAARIGLPPRAASTRSCWVTAITADTDLRLAPLFPGCQNGLSSACRRFRLMKQRLKIGALLKAIRQAEGRLAQCPYHSRRRAPLIRERGQEARHCAFLCGSS